MNTTPTRSRFAAVGTFLALALVCLTLAAPVLAAETPAPGWEVTSTTFPTYLGAAVNEVQAVTVAASEGTFTLSFRGQETAAISFEASPATVQADLEALPSIGAGNVTVTGGPGDPAGTQPYVITFLGALADRDAGAVIPNGEQLGGGSATDVVRTEGRPSGALELAVYNVGGAPSSGQVTVTDTLPAGVLATSAGDVQPGAAEMFGQAGLWECTGNAVGESPRKIGEFEPASVVTCVNSPALPVLPRPEPLAEAGSGTILEIGVGVIVQNPKDETLMNDVTVAGGGASSPASSSAPMTVSSVPVPPFGFQRVDGWASRANGTLDTQAGSHPYEVDFSFDLNSFLNFSTNGNATPELEPAGGRPRELAVNLPPGLIGNPTAVPQCTRTDFDNERCDPATQVGTDIANADVIGHAKLVSHRIAFAVYNLVPPPGLPAQFGFVLAGQQVFLDAGVRSGGDYGITVHAHALPQGHAIILGNRIVLWGEPSDPSHKPFRYSNFWEGQRCGTEISDPEAPGCSTTAPRVPFLTLASSCGGPQQTVASVDAWETAGLGELGFFSHDANSAPVGVSGCDGLTFAPSISVAPDTSSADTPAGLTVDVRVPQEGLVTPGALATSDIKDTTVVLPAGVVINPGQAAGLQACKAGDVPGGDDLPLPGENGEEERFDGPPACPNASKVGTIAIETPLLTKPLTGDVYVLQSNPPHLKLLFAASGEGVNLKLVAEASECETAGEVLDGKACEAPGQLITKVTDAPQLPFTDFQLSFSGGAQAALDTPTQCGTFTTTSDFEPWSAPAVGDAFPSSSFQITSGPGGSPCPGASLPFAPSMVAGVTSDKAGALTGFSLLLQRGDDQQRIEKLAFKQPAGVGGLIAGVPLCGEPQASQGTCPASSQIGHAVVSSGPGPYPLVLPQPGAPELPIYLTGPYQGAPFGLSIVTPVVAGPFNLGTVVTRAKIEIDPATAQISVVTDALPQQVAGVPTDLRSIDSVIDRPNFLYNPTNCEPQAFTGVATSAEGATAPLSSHFGVGSCRELAFHPRIATSTGAKGSRLNGVSLHFLITPAKAAQGTQAWLKELKFTLPRQFPSRLTTIQKACTANVFEHERSKCPTASIIGHAVVRTPDLPVPLEGPVYFVSYGNKSFPEVVLVLKGDNVTIEEHGETLIEGGVTTATFRHVPDAPFTSVEVTLPAGRYSEFAANLPHERQDFCGRNISMPTFFKAQNGLQTRQNVRITITGCPHSRKATRAQKLTGALKACHKKHGRKRASCEKTAHRAFGARAHRKTTAHHSTVHGASASSAPSLGHAATVAFQAMDKALRSLSG
jgi:hypothetical protein